MNTYLIPKVNENDFLKKVNKYIVKSNGIIKVIPGEIEYLDLNDGTDRKYACRRYEVEGIYKLNGWEFIGEIEHKENGNVFRIINENHKDIVFKLYENAPAKCEHCGTIRKRRNTFIVYNESEKTYKQVGKGCLQEYTGFDVDKCALLSSFLKDIIPFKTIDFNNIESYSTYYNNYTIRKIIYHEVLSNGYDKINSRFIVKDVYSNKELKTEICHNIEDSIIEKISQWLDEKTQKPSEYYSSCKTIWNSNEIEFRDFNYLLSMINLYLKDMNNKSLINNEYVGNIGDKINLIVKSRRVLFTRGPYATNGNIQDVYEIIDTKGYTYIWATSTYIEELDLIKATIKEHKEYKGIKQTVITRGTVINNLKKEYKEKINNEPQENVWKVLEEYC